MSTQPKENPIILHLETADKNCSVAITQGHELLCLCEERDEQFSHSKKLHTFIQWAMEGAEINAEKLDAVAVDAGPGSYTGLRIGVSAAKGLCFALGIPLLSIDSLEVLAAQVLPSQHDYVIPMLDARRNEVYCKVLDAEGNTVEETQAKVLDDESFLDYQDSSILFIGKGAEKAKDLLNPNLNAEFNAELDLSAKHMTKGILRAYKEESFEDLAYFEPSYLKDFIAGKPKNYFKIN